MTVVHLKHPFVSWPVLEYYSVTRGKTQTLIPAHHLALLLMRHLLLLIGGLLLALPVSAQSFVIDDARPQHGAAGVAPSSEVAFAFSEEISVGTDWNTAFVFEPSDSLRYNQVSLCLNFEGACAGGDDVPRFVRFQAEHQPDTDYTWMVYAVETPGGKAMDEPFVLRYTTASSIGQQSVAGAVQAPIAKAAAWTPQVRASLRTLARGLKRNGLGRPFFDRQPADIDPNRVAEERDESTMHSHFGTIGAKSHSGGHTQVLLLSDFDDTEAQWAVRAADVVPGASGAYTVEYLREETFWPVAVRYTDGSNTEIEAFGYHDADGDGTPDPISTASGDRANVDIQLYEFPLTTARAQRNLSVAIDSAAQYASDQALRLIQAGDGVRPAGTAYQWTYRFLSPSSDTETRVTVDPLNVTVTRAPAGGFLTEMSTVPDNFIDSNEALQIALNDGGDAFIDPFRPRNITTILQGGNLYWTDTPVATEEFWRVRIITATSTQVRSFDRYIDMASGDILDASDNPNVPAAPADFDGASGDGEVTLTWTANTEDDLAEYRLYRSTEAPGSGGTTIIASANQIATIPAGTQSYTDAEVTNGQTYFYQVTAVDTEELESTPSPLVNAFPYPASLEISITRSFGNPSEQRNYRLVALPGDGATPVASTLEGAAGDAWTVYWDDGSSDDFLRAYDGSSTFGFQPGRGFWMLSRSAWAPSGTADAVPLASDGTYAIDLHDGWNIIANPFDRDVTWSAVQAANSVTQALWRWDGSFREASTFASAQSGEAFYFLNDGGLDELVLPYPGAPDALPAATAATPSTTALTLTAFQDEQRMSAVRAGLASEAAEGRDALDQFAPPGYFEGTTLQLINPQVDETYTALAAEYRAAGQEGYAFDLSLQGAPGQVVQLRADGLASFDGQKVVLVDPTTGRAYDLKTRSTVKVRPPAEETNLKLLVGSAAFVDRAQSAIVPTTLQLLPNYPNPFRARTTLEFTLPERRDVRLVIYDVLGRRVRTLVDRSFDAGRHTMRWDGRNTSGQPVASGIYLGRLEVGDQRQVQRLVLVR